ncbi:coenzyme F420-dependent glucose-6-phosphate dehydrogenase [Thermosporothrix hazakensis]|jgi:coenzyme F420-dependent glucose-6-phosphate dehydrogenase|uniref:Coenzyme F420-dependent glucose-6-phosphate dehydrogenase n=1 Tax=Thermosporothrix hazakensis TaxID=644383 RepID=A0A326UE11_THEHA|nr:glucose-6-phosphate dehydrogenase (coenzyme-F420) [Thermosporothrix hazakensis]PZW36718.1 coenzyme F420-dependent glucose-6-phosphate dehydrogenase [Thermosporothrix hazakensis]GCE47369.1 F420-dependent glucose-6-phosphate dehydrogenase [Thermosporothrix hazakensis]
MARFPLKLGYKASAEQFGPQHLLDLAIEAENNGFDSVWISDHFQPWRHTDGHAPFAPSWMAAVGQRTKRIVLGTSVLTPTFRYQPAVVAQAFGTLGVLTPGRIILGVGSGEALNEIAVANIEWPSAKERLARLGESVELIRRLWTEDLVTFDGKYYHTRNATIYDKPSQPIPIYMGAGGPVAAKLAGRLGDGFICTSGKGDELYRDKLIPGLDAGAKAAGRDPEQIERMIEIKVSFDTDRDRALKDTRIWAALALPAEDKVAIHDPREMERKAEEVADQAHRRWLVSNDPEEHIEQIRPYIELGFTHLVFHAPGNDQSRFLKLYAKEILPRLRQRWG